MLANTQPREKHPPGELMLAEIREQPAALRRLLEVVSELAPVAERLRRAQPSVIRLVGHGTSDNAATYGVYAVGLLCGWTALRDSISLTVYYDAPLDLRGSAVIALSQSGQTPDVVDYVERIRARGALTVAFTNDPTSPLADTAELVLLLHAGPERAVAATKTYLNSLAALALLAGYTADNGKDLAEGLHATAETLEGAISALEQPVARTAADFAFIGRMFVIGRGLELATAREIALKLQETCRGQVSSRAASLRQVQPVLGRPLRRSARDKKPLGTRIWPERALTHMSRNEGVPGSSPGVGFAFSPVLRRFAFASPDSNEVSAMGGLPGVLASPAGSDPWRLVRLFRIDGRPGSVP
jgi:fructoselysine-6-P-deglycase FrlB-like protein